MKKVYVSLIADLLHAGHVRILQKAYELSENEGVIVGLLSLQACGELNDVPYLDYDKRKEALLALKFVKEVVVQESASYKENLLRIKPDFVVHGDDWAMGGQG